MKQKKNNKTKLAYDFLRQKIMDGTYAPGIRIVIDQIAKDLQTSAIPIREAIRQLEADGFIQYKPYSGPIVSTINEAQYIDILSVLAVLEGYATALCSRNISTEKIGTLTKLNRQMEKMVKGFELEQFQKLNLEFHSIIYEQCNNLYVREEISETQQRLDRLRRSIFTFVPNRILQSIKEHDEIIELFKKKAPIMEIEEKARMHKLNTVSAFQRRDDSAVNTTNGGSF